MTVISDESVMMYPLFPWGNSDRLNTTTMLPASSCIILFIHHLDRHSVSSTGHCHSHDGQGQEKLRKHSFVTASVVLLVTSDIETLRPAEFSLFFQFGRCLAVFGLKSWVSVEGLSLLWLHSGQQTLPCIIFHFARFSCSSHPPLFVITCWKSCAVARRFYQAACSGKHIYPFVRQMDLVGKYT